MVFKMCQRTTGRRLGWGPRCDGRLASYLTRGKKLVVLVGTKKALGMAVRRQDTNQRYTA